MASSSPRREAANNENTPEIDGSIHRVKQEGGLTRVCGWISRYFSGGKLCRADQREEGSLSSQSSSGSIAEPPSPPFSLTQQRTSSKSSKRKCPFCKRTRRFHCHSESEVADHASPSAVTENKRLIDINTNQGQSFCSNYTRTAKYTLLTFLPLFLFEQFRRYSNIFFLFIATLQQIPGVSPTGRFVTLTPLLFILAISAIKEIVEDIKRHHDDNEVNHRQVELLDRTTGRLSKVVWKNLHVGDIVRVQSNEFFPADLILLSSNRPNALSFVETANLDGETTIKVRQGVGATAELVEIKDLLAARGSIEYEMPNRHLYEFLGVLKLANQDIIILGPDQLLQRGAALRNTSFIYGIVIYTGHETKLMKNFAKAPLKSSSVDRLVNIQILLLFVVFLLISFFSATMCYRWNREHSKAHTYLGMPTEVNLLSIGFNLMTFFILVNNLIPISLQVTLEMVRVSQAYFINRDVNMYYADTNTPAVARTSNLNEELGMVKYILSDKTGTLTRNIMEFKKCSVAGRVYKMATSVPEDAVIVKHLKQNEPNAALIREFLVALSLCHTVIPEVLENGQVVYHATSPDDRAIVEGLRQFGFIFIDRTTSHIEIECLGSREKYELLQVNEFTSERKRMSVVVRTPEGQIKVYSKGADTVMLERLSELRDEFFELAMQHLSEFASSGLRTLCCGVAIITEEEFKNWQVLFQGALKNVSRSRETELEKVKGLLEANLNFLGVTAIEDKLQLGVPETIQSLLEAGICLWVLTGDKQETAINISYSCRLITRNMLLIILNENSLADTIETIKKHLLELRRYNNLCLIIDGATLNFALSCTIYKEFLELCLKCRSVICCRVSPLQKAEMAELIVSTGACTLAIGDGANDVAMIRRANVGVGISGVEGLQAASAADYSIAQFRFLKRLLLVHGAWNYRRVTMCILYSFYKNVCMSLIQWWFCFYNGWSGQIIFERWTIGSYNMVFTALPCFIMGVFDRLCDAPVMLKYPIIYRRGHDGKLFNVRIFWIWIVTAFIHSILLFWIPMITYTRTNSIWMDGKVNDMFAMGTIIYTYVVVTVSLKVGLMTHSWIWLTHFSIWGSILFWFIYMLIYSFFYPTLVIGNEFRDMYIFVLSTPIFWFGLILLPCATLLIDFYAKVSYNTLSTTVTEAVREAEREARKEHQIQLSSNRARTTNIS